MRFYTTEQLGPKQSLTPEGFLLCQGVPIARTGVMLYGPDETPIEADGDGMVRIVREEKEVFRPETIASFNGKPVVDEHPDEDVNPANWKELACGVVIDPRRGKGIEDDLLLADLLITDPEMIKEVQAGKREVSCGYDSEYYELGPGRGRQYDIVGNHVALVESGRCGSRCSIGDQAYKEKSRMSKWKDRIMRAFKAKDEAALSEALDAAPVKDEEEMPASGSSNEVHVHVHPHTAAPAVTDEEEKPAGEEKKEETKETKDNDLESRVGALEAGLKEIKDLLTKMTEGGQTGDEEKKKDGEEKAQDSEKKDDEKTEDEAGEEKKDDEKTEDAKGQEVYDAAGEKVFDEALEEEAPEGMKDKAKKARDSAYLEDSFQQTVALAEILAPGIRIPTFDRAADPKKSYVGICGLRRKALHYGASTDAATLKIVESVTGFKTIDADSFSPKRMTCDRVRTVFFAAAAMKREKNNASRGVGSYTADAGNGGGSGVRGSVRTPADLNRELAKYYAGDAK